MTPPPDDFFKRGMETLTDPTRVQAGREYTRSLVSLGLDPDLSCWVYLPTEDRAELAIVTTMVDRIGPLKLYDTLFTAYEMSATPRNLNPFDVSLYSPRTALGLDLLTAIRLDKYGRNAWDADQRPLWENAYVVGLNETKVVAGVGIYRTRVYRENADRDRVRWKKFKANVDALAA